MPKNIAKKFTITLDTINQKLITNKDFVMIIGDSIEITANIIENGQPKNLENCNIRMIGIKSNQEPLEQTEDIMVEDTLNGVVKIYPDINKFNVIGRCIIGLLIEDSDETINIQRFSLELRDSLYSGIIENSKESVETLAKLNTLLDDYSTNLTSINQQVIDLQDAVNTKSQEIDNSFSELEISINNAIKTLNDKISGVDNTINYELVKGIKLEPYRLVGSNFIYLQSNTFNVYASELLKRSYIVSIGGIVQESYYNTAIGILNFYKQNNKIYPMFISLSDRMLNNKRLQPSIVFNDLTNEILPTATNFKIMIKSNIHKDLNTDSDVYGVLTPLALQ